MIYSYSWPVHIDEKGAFPMTGQVSEILIQDWKREHPDKPWLLTLSIAERKPGEYEPEADAART